MVQGCWVLVCSQNVCELVFTAAQAKATDAAVVHVNSVSTKSDVGPSGSKSAVGIASCDTSEVSSRVSLVTEHMLRGKRWPSLNVKVKGRLTFLSVAPTSSPKRERKRRRDQDARRGQGQNEKLDYTYRLVRVQVVDEAGMLRHMSDKRHVREGGGRTDGHSIPKRLHSRVVGGIKSRRQAQPRDLGNGIEDEGN